VTIYVPPNTEALYELHQSWLTRVLPARGSLLSDREVWTPGNLASLDGVFEKSVEGTSFLERLHGQLSDASDDVIQLMAEVHIVHFLHIWEGSISPTKKRSDIETILSWMSVPVRLTESVVASLSPGVCHPGQWVMSKRHTQLSWIMTFAAQFQTLDEVKRVATLGDGFEFKRFVNGVPGKSADGARLAMTHLTFPTVFEPIVSTDDREYIVARFGHQSSSDRDIDLRLADARAALEPLYGPAFDWYAGDLVLRWRRPSKQWNQLMKWVARARAMPDFDHEERTYKFTVSADLRTVKDVIESDGDWPLALKRALTSTHNNLTRFDLNQHVVAWATTDRKTAAEALRALFIHENDPMDAARRFLAALPEAAASGRGERLSILSVLMMTRSAADFPPMKISALRAAFRLLGWPKDDSLDDAGVYERALLLFDEVVFDAKQRSIPLRDRLDAQSALWALLRYESKPSGWSDAEWDELVKYRKSSAAELEPDSEDGGLAEQAPAAVVEEFGPTEDFIASAAKDLLVDRKVLDEIVHLLDDKGQVVLYGPPGTGKTFLALRLARALARGVDERVRLVQFHPATAYEDFIEGLRPRLVDGQLTYELVAGPLVRIAEQALADPTNRYVLVIDEINRANLPKVFGELLFLLEYRHESAHTINRPDETLRLPENLAIIGTMNTADRSVALIDAAMRRRFHFIPFFPHDGPMKGLLHRWLQTKKGPRGVGLFLDAVNIDLEKDHGEHLLVGPSHFMRTDLSEAALERIWTYNVFPLIEELYWGDRESIARWRWSAVSQRYAKELGGDQPAQRLDLPTTESAEES
jgi:5-methylcytosine-specific restriction protein B